MVVQDSRSTSQDPPAMRRRLSEQGGVILSTHFFLRWPVYIFIASAMVMLLSVYFTVRGMIKLFENFWERSHVKKLKRRMLGAKSYREWQHVARKLDTYSGVDGWKHTRRSRHYNAEAIDKYTHDLQVYRGNNDPDSVLSVLRSCLSDPLTSGVLREELYSQCWDGTKTIVEEYVQTVVMGICYLTQALERRSASTSLQIEIIDFLNRCSYGRTGLCLSGGGAMGQQHFGVVRAMIEENVLPTVISGTSAGAVVGAFFCCRTDEEIQRDFSPEIIMKQSTALQSSWPARIVRFIRTGVLFDFEEWAREVTPWTMGDLTFLEAFKKTGRIFNVSTTAGDCSVNLNYITSPNVLVRSAVLCSSAMPIFVKPPQLLEKDLKTNEIFPRDIQNFSDGSLAGDVPRGELGSLFGVRFVLTSQVNPHITPFFFNRKGEAGNPLLWRWGKQGSFRGGFILSALESIFKEQMKSLLKVMHELELDPAFRGMDLPQAFLQNFEGDITVTSHRHFMWKALHSLSGPESAKEIEWWIKEGELSMWPKMSVMISRMRIEKALVDLGSAASHSPLDNVSSTG